MAHLPAHRPSGFDIGRAVAGQPSAAGAQDVQVQTGIRRQEVIQQVQGLLGGVGNRAALGGHHPPIRPQLDRDGVGGRSGRHLGKHRVQGPKLLETSLGAVNPTLQHPALRPLQGVGQTDDGRRHIALGELAQVLLQQPKLGGLVGRIAAERLGEGGLGPLAVAAVVEAQGVNGGFPVGVGGADGLAQQVGALNEVARQQAFGDVGEIETLGFALVQEAGRIGKGIEPRKQLLHVVGAQAIAVGSAEEGQPITAIGVQGRIRGKDS